MCAAACAHSAKVGAAQQCAVRKIRAYAERRCRLVPCSLRTQRRLTGMLQRTLLGAMRTLKQLRTFQCCCTPKLFQCLDDL